MKLPSSEKAKRLKSVFSQLALVCFALLVSGLLINAWLRPSDLSGNIEISEEKKEALVELRDVTIDPENLPTIYREVDYSEGDRGNWYPKGEAPSLAELVSEGRLPSVAERVGREPAVLEGIDGVGEYGGTWLRVAVSMSDINVIDWRLPARTLVRWSPHGYPIVPHVAKGWEHSDDYKIWRFYLRKGMKWSDGHPFTADDLLYYFYDHKLHFEKQAPRWLRINGQPGEIVKIDDHTVEYRFPLSNPLFLARAAIENWYCEPKHYMEQFHPEHGDQDKIAEYMKAYKLPTPRALYMQLRSTMNPERPQITPWIYRVEKANPPFNFVRNPYYWAVDTEGNQLPYIDRVMFEIQPKKQLVNSAAQGRISMQARHLTFDNYSLLMANRDKGDYDVYHWFSGTRSIWAIFPNMDRRIDPDDPAGQERWNLLNDKRFRQALSLAIDRQSIIDSEYYGIGEPSQIAPGKSSEFHNEMYAKLYTEFDPDTANRLLDELGLDKRDKEGFRLFPNGERMTWRLWVTEFSGQGPVELIVKDWQRVGLRTVFSYKGRRLFDAAKNGRLQDFMVWTGEGEYNPLVTPRSFGAFEERPGVHGVQAEHFAKWYLRGGFQNHPDSIGRGAVEPPIGHPLRVQMELLDQVNVSIDFEKQKALLDQLIGIASENVWSISIATPPPQIAVVKRNIRNVYPNLIFGVMYLTPGNGAVETFYFENNQDPPGFQRALKGEIGNGPVLRVAVDADGAVSKFSGKLIKYVLLLSLLTVLLLLGLRHPYIGRRLMVMVPTLLVISGASFVVIQLPPSNFIEQRMMDMEIRGDDAAMAQLEEMKKLFHTEDPMLSQYARWLGLYWFLSFDASDLGLLQGHLGRTMEENLRPVNDIVGDRIVMTLLISLFTIVFTWAIALPIGVYSAVKQYSFADYFFTFWGFLGMCFPNFLLALLLMYWSFSYFGIDMSGLFSAKYAVQPYWSWGKFVDLLKHIWVPVVVLGTGGTAGMMRIMRGNLLDELSKPYVTTARAKGVRPLKTLIKYPVRLALNPFISGIGSIFPRLISGGAIVAIVLSLPTVGPLMLAALLMEDTYMAGSLLMVLSLLGVFGTLVSDLLLLWLDPRIRMEGGAR